MSPVPDGRAETAGTRWTGGVSQAETPCTAPLWRGAHDTEARMDEYERLRSEYGMAVVECEAVCRCGDCAHCDTYAGPARTEDFAAASARAALDAHVRALAEERDSLAEQVRVLVARIDVLEGPPRSESGTTIRLNTTEAGNVE